MRKSIFDIGILRINFIVVNQPNLLVDFGVKLKYLIHCI